MQTFGSAPCRDFQRLSPTFPTSLAAFPHHSLHYRCVLIISADIKQGQTQKTKENKDTCMKVRQQNGRLSTRQTKLVTFGDLCPMDGLNDIDFNWQHNKTLSRSQRLCCFTHSTIMTTGKRLSCFPPTVAQPCSLVSYSVRIHQKHHLVCKKTGISTVLDSAGERGLTWCASACAAPHRSARRGWVGGPRLWMVLLGVAWRDWEALGSLCSRDCGQTNGGK